MEKNLLHLKNDSHYKKSQFAHSKLKILQIEIVGNSPWIG